MSNMRLTVALLTFVLAGCSTVGNIEAMNNVEGLRQVREVAATMAKMDRKRNAPVVNTGAINRKYGEMQGLNNRKYDFHDVPHLIQSLDYILR